MRKILLLLFLTMSLPSISEAFTKTATINWSMLNIPDVQGYKIYYSYNTGMENKIWHQDCGAAQQTGTNEYSITCNNINITAFPVYFTINAVTPSGEISSGVKEIDSTISMVQDFGLLVPNVSPTASFSASTTTGYAPLAVSFNAANSTDSDGTISSFSWNFGDGSSATGVNLSHTFTTAGTFPVILTVTDNNGATGQTQTSITTIAPPESTPPPSTSPIHAINFQPANVPIPSGFIADSGLVFDAGRGYGWTITAGSEGTRDRDNSTSPDQSYDTLIMVAATGKWEIPLAAGTYTITLCVGDPYWQNTMNVIQAEGTTVVNDPINSTNIWVEKTATIAINDGRLTLTFTGSTPYAKLCWIKIYKQ